MEVWFILLRIHFFRNRILLENETLDELLKAIDNRNTSLRESDINSVRRFYENERNSNLKIVDTLELLKR